MSDPPLTHDPADFRHDIVAGPTGRLVDDDPTAASEVRRRFGHQDSATSGPASSATLVTNASQFGRTALHRASSSARMTPATEGCRDRGHIDVRAMLRMLTRHPESLA